MLIIFPLTAHIHHAVSVQTLISKSNTVVALWTDRPSLLSCEFSIVEVICGSCLPWWRLLRWHACTCVAVKPSHPPQWHASVPPTALTWGRESFRAELTGRLSSQSMFYMWSSPQCEQLYPALPLKSQTKQTEASVNMTDALPLVHPLSSHVYSVLSRLAGEWLLSL